MERGVGKQSPGERNKSPFGGERALQTLIAHEGAQTLDRPASIGTLPSQNGRPKPGSTSREERRQSLGRLLNVAPSEESLSAAELQPDPVLSRPAVQRRDTHPRRSSLTRLPESEPEIQPYPEETAELRIPRDRRQALVSDTAPSLPHPISDSRSGLEDAQRHPLMQHISPGKGRVRSHSLPGGVTYRLPVNRRVHSLPSEPPRSFLQGLAANASRTSDSLPRADSSSLLGPSSQAEPAHSVRVSFSDAPPAVSSSAAEALAAEADLPQGEAVPQAEALSWAERPRTKKVSFAAFQPPGGTDGTETAVKLALLRSFGVEWLAAGKFEGRVGGPSVEGLGVLSKYEGGTYAGEVSITLCHRAIPPQTFLAFCTVVVQ